MYVKITLIALGIFNFILGLYNLALNRKAIREGKKQTNMIEDNKK